MRRLFAKPLPAVLLLLGSQAGLLAYSAYVHSPTDLEPEQLAAGIGVWRFGRFDLFNVNPPLVRSIAALPVLASDAVIDDAWFDVAQGGAHARVIGDTFVRANGGLESCWYFTLARWACIPLVLSGGVACFLWARELYGAAAGLLALALWCFEPNLLGHGSLITNDVPAASLGLWAGYQFWRWLRVPTWSRAMLAGVALGLAELTKLSWLLLFGLWPALWIFWGIGGALAARCAARTGLISGETAVGSQQWRSKFAQLLVVLALAVYLINVFYAFNGTGKKLSQFQFVSRALTGRDSPGLPGNRFLGSWLGALRVPLPAEYVQGADLQERDLEHFAQPSFLNGEWKQGGWWYYYLYGLWVKLPHGFQLLLLVAVAANLRGTVVSARNDAARLVTVIAWRDALVVLAPAAALLAIASARTELNQYVRYVWPCLGFCMVFCGSLLGRAFSRNSIFRARFARILASACVLCAVASGMRAFPHNLSYFNELAGGPSGGARRLAGANSDWGQDLLFLKRWLEAHPESTSVRLAVSGIGVSCDQIAHGEPPPGPTDDRSIHISEDEAEPHPGWYAVSLSRLARWPTGEGYRPDYGYFAAFEPLAKIGHSIHIYYLAEDAVNQFRLANNLPDYDAWMAARLAARKSQRAASTSPADHFRGAGPNVKEVPAVLEGDADELTVTFDVVNDSTRSVVIESVMPSCNCSSASVDRDDLAPGARTVLRVVVDLVRRTGEFSIETIVGLSDGRQLRCVAPIAVYPRFTSRPEQLSFGVIGPNERQRQEFNLLTYGRDDDPPIPEISTGADDGRLRVSAIDCSVRAIRDGIKERRTVIAVDVCPDRVLTRPGACCSCLTARCGACNELRIPIHWTVKSQFDVTPGTVFFGTVEAGERTLERRIIVRRDDRRVFQITALDSTHAAFRCVAVQDQSTSEHELTISVDPARVDKFAYGNILVKTDDSVEPQIVVSVAASAMGSNSDK